LSSENICKPEAVDSLNLAGLLFFLIGHIMYIVWLLRFTVGFNYWLLSICVVLPCIMFLMAKLKILQPGKATVPCIAYAAVIGLMLAAAINVYLKLGGETISKLILVGGILFTVSDCCLAVFNFGGTKPNWLKYLYMPTYYAAQLIFAISILY
jgi:YhhN-like protein.